MRHCWQADGGVDLTKGKNTDPFTTEAETIKKLRETQHSMEIVMKALGVCAGVEDGDVDGLLEWAEKHSKKPEVP